MHGDELKDAEAQYKSLEKTQWAKDSAALEIIVAMKTDIIHGKEQS